ncbi:D-mannonate oxidoreductase [Xenophilus sp. AP218F]|nr:D-mannonate oxidoreductase [Xenophilus sp. AP218F]
MKQPFDVSLDGRVAVVTGAAGVLCSELAWSLARAGAKVALLDLNGAAAAELAQAMRGAGHAALGLEANALDRASLQAAADEIAARLGPCDILVNGAGGNHPKGTTSRETFDAEQLQDPALTSFFDLEPEGVEFVFRLNFMGTLLPAQVFARQMLGRAGCAVINISSMNAFRPLTKIPAYSAAKAAVSNFTQWMATHFAPAGIRVNALAPGFFLTNQNHALLVEEGSGEWTPRARKILNQTPMGRFGEAHELAGTLLWLASEPASGFVTGVVIPVDGGFSAYSGV